MTLEEFEQEAREELDDVKKQFRDRVKKENERSLETCDSEHWFCVSFTSRAQKEELLHKLGLDKDSKYIDGREFAKHVNRALRTPDQQFSKPKKFDKEFIGMSMEP